MFLCLSGSFAHCYLATRLQHNSFDWAKQLLHSSVTQNELHSPPPLCDCILSRMRLAAFLFLCSINTQHNY